MERESEFLFRLVALLATRHPFRFREPPLLDSNELPRILVLLSGGNKSVLGRFLGTATVRSRTVSHYFNVLSRERGGLGDLAGGNYSRELSHLPYHA